MSQLADLESVIIDTFGPTEDAGHLFFDILCALRWDIEGVGNGADAYAYLNRHTGVDEITSKNLVQYQPDSNTFIG